MSPPPRVTVIVPVYNEERFLFAAAASILRQTFKDFELILVDDGSTDASTSMVADFAATDDRVKPVTLVHCGQSRALNAGRASARGDLLAIIGADDVAHPGWLATMAAFFDDHRDVAAAGCELEVIDETGNRIDAWERREDAHVDIDAFPPVLHLPYHPGSVMRREAVEAIGGYRPMFDSAEDLDLFLRLQEKGVLRNVRKKLVAYRTHRNAISSRDARTQALRAAVALHFARLRRSGRPEPNPVHGISTLRSAGATGRRERRRLAGLADFMILKACRDRNLRLTMAERLRFRLGYGPLSRFQDPEAVAAIRRLRGDTSPAG